MRDLFQMEEMVKPTRSNPTMEGVSQLALTHLQICFSRSQSGKGPDTKVQWEHLRREATRSLVTEPEGHPFLVERVSRGEHQREKSPIGEVGSHEPFIPIGKRTTLG